jgi:hypothetical protein
MKPGLKLELKFWMYSFHYFNQLKYFRNLFNEVVIIFLADFPYFEKIKVGLWDHHAICVSVYPPPPINFWMPGPIFMKLGMYIMALIPSQRLTS